jgi:hypothetical protein
MAHHIEFHVEENADAAVLEARLNQLRFLKREPQYILGDLTIAYLEHLRWCFGEHSDQIDLTNNGCTLTGRASLSGLAFMAFSNLSKKAGKWYCELKYNNSINNSMTFGVVGFGHQVYGRYPGDSADSYGLYAYDGKKYTDGVAEDYGSEVSTDDVIMMALDMDNGEIWWGLNDTWFDSGNPVTRANPAYTGISGYKFVAVSLSEPFAQVTAAFGPKFKYTAPTGFLPYQA